MKKIVKYFISFTVYNDINNITGVVVGSFFVTVTLQSSSIPPACKPFMITMCIVFCIGLILRTIWINKIAMFKYGKTNQNRKAMGVVINDEKIGESGPVTTSASVNIV